MAAVPSDVQASIGRPLHWFRSGDTVRTLHDPGLMRVIVAIGEKVHCEWLVGTELHQRAFPARALRLIEG